VVTVGALAEAADHHPDIEIRYRAVTLRLSSHDADGITRRDVSLAREIDALAPPPPPPPAVPPSSGG